MADVDIQSQEKNQSYQWSGQIQFASIICQAVERREQ